MPQQKPATDADLIARARQGDQAAFRDLVHRYEPLVAATVIGMLGRGSDADDVGQQTFVRFYKALHQFRGDAALGTYLTRIAMNLSLNALKRRKRWQLRFLSRDAHVLDEPATEPETTLDDRDRDRLVQAAIQRLDPKFRSVVVLRLMQGYSTKETAQMLDIPVGTVLSRLARAQTKLKNLLQAYLPDLTP